MWKLLSHHTQVGERHGGVLMPSTCLLTHYRWKINNIDRPADLHLSDRTDNLPQPRTSLVTSSVLETCQSSFQWASTGGYTVQSCLIDRTDILNFNLVVDIWPKAIGPSGQRHVRRKKFKRRHNFPVEPLKCVWEISKNNTSNIVEQVRLIYAQG